MNGPRVSVVMPAFNQERYIAESIESVLEQHFMDWEVVVIDDGSTDNTAAIINKFKDARIRYYHQPSKGVCEARNLGIQYSKGQYIAFLDADDLFHPDKLDAQVAFLDSNPEVGLVYVSRIEINQDGSRLNLVLQPEIVDLASVVLGFPFAPSDLMVRRYWLQRTGGFDPSFVINEDREWYIRIILDGCVCRGIRRFLSYRRLNDRKLFKDLPAQMDDMLRALQPAFQGTHPLASDQNVQTQAYRNIYKIWTYQAAIQGETALAKRYFLEAERYSDATECDLNEWSRYFLHASIRDGGDHEKRLHAIFDQFVNELPQFDLDQMVLLGSFMQGIRHLMWGRFEQAKEHLTRELHIDSYFDAELVNNLIDMFANYEEAFGIDATNNMIAKVVIQCKGTLAHRNYRALAGTWLFNRAFKAFVAGDYFRVIKKAGSAVFLNPNFIFNRGLASIFVRSLFKIISSLFIPSNYRRGAPSINSSRA